ncbi:unnamed protein product [Pleuronectes platessa]|uniref:Uncharacterized protein n=1 Tax=Pleuronectes platessa TaxID=8262 RepID=A0A9N7Y8G8_PLEPL|nr:unnamed protein product [Pleuronectes platessa]
MITNPFNKDAEFRVVLVESTFNPLEPGKEKESFIQQASSTAQIKKTAPDMSCVEDVEGNPSSFNTESSDFLSAEGSVCLKSGQTHTLDIHYLPLLPGTKYGSVLLVCPQVGDMVYIVKATAELPLPFPAHCQANFKYSLHHQQLCAKPALQSGAGVRGDAIRKLSHQQLHTQTLFGKQAQLLSGTDQCKVVTYSVEVSLPQYFTLPSTVQIPIKEDTNVPWEDPADCDYVDIPLRFQADRVGQFTCQVVLKTSREIRVYMLEALVTSKGESNHLDFSSPAHCSVTQDIPVHNETQQDWNMQAEVCGEAFCGPKVLNVPAGTKACYPLSFHPSAQSVFMGKLSLQNDCGGAEHVFTLRGVGERPLPVDHVVSYGPAGKTS